MPNVILYKTDKCHRCYELQGFLIENRIPFLTKDLQDPAVLTDLRTEGIFCMEAPMLQLGHEYLDPMHLFKQNGSIDSEAIKTLLERWEAI